MKTNEIVEDKTVGDLSESKLEKLLIKFLLDEPFFSSIIARVRKIRTLSIPTAGVSVHDNSITLYWNPNFIAKLTKRKFFGLMKHECYHLIFKHVTSRKQDPHILWNIATDLAINSIIDIDDLPDGGLYPGKPLDFNRGEKEDNTPLDAKMKESAKKLSDAIASFPPGKASEWYMEKLLSDEELSQAAQDCFGDGSEGAGFDVHIDPDSEMSESDKQLVEGKVKEIIRKSAERAQRNNSWGSCSGSVRQQIVASMSDGVDWKKTLKYFCGTKQKANRSRTFRRINRKYPYIHPGRKTNHTSNLAIYIDQSGSVGDDGISAFFSTLNELARNVSFKVFHFDSNVDKGSEYPWRKGQKYRLPMRTLCGGTCFDAVEAHYRTRAAEFDGYIVMTDGCAPKPKSCISKRCWVLLPGYSLYFTPDKKDAVVSMKTQ